MLNMTDRDDKRLAEAMLIQDEGIDCWGMTCLDMKYDSKSWYKKMKSYVVESESHNGRCFHLVHNWPKCCDPELLDELGIDITC